MQGKLFIGMLILALLTGSLRANPSHGLVAYYPFSGDASDASGQGRDGTVHGATLCPDRFGNIDSAYCFDGDDYILVADPPTLTTAATWAAWVYLGDLQRSAMVINKAEYLTPQTFSIAVGEPPDRLPRVRIHGISGASYLLDGTHPLSPGTWTHVAGVYSYDGSTGRLTMYINGEEDGHVEVPEALYQNSAALYFGCDYNNPASYWVGRTDEIRIYNQALSATEIEELYVIPEPGTALLGMMGLSMVAGYVLKRRRAT